MNTYQKCYYCSQYINTVTTDHYIIKMEDGSEVRVHIRPCAQRIIESELCEIIKKVLCHQNRS